MWLREISACNTLKTFSQLLQIMHIVIISVENESILTWHTLKYFLLVFVPDG